MALHDVLRPFPEEADEINEQFILDSADPIFPTALKSIHAPRRRERIVRIAQYYIWMATDPECIVEASRDLAMAKVTEESSDDTDGDEVTRNQLHNAVYALYDDTSDPLKAFEVDLKEAALAYEATQQER